MTKILTATIAAAVLTLGALAVSPNVEAARKPVRADVELGMPAVPLLNPQGPRTALAVG